jgi:hypothetical protein
MALCATYEKTGRRAEESDTTAVRTGIISDLGHSFGNPGSGVSLISSDLPQQGAENVG